MARCQAALLLVLAVAIVACHAADDPTVSMKGVHDLSELLAGTAWQPDSLVSPRHTPRSRACDVL